MSSALRLAAFGAVCLVGVPNTRAGDPTIEDIAQALQQWKASWVTLRVTYETRNPEQLRNYSNDPEILNADSLEDYFNVEEWILTDRGSRRHEFWSANAGVPNPPLISAQNAEKHLNFSASYRRAEDGATVLSQLKVGNWTAPAPGGFQADPSMFVGFRSCEPLFPLYEAGEWLGEILARLEGTVDDFDEIDGIRCPRIRYGGYDFWFDPEHGLLPRRVVPTPDNTRHDVWNVHAFRRLENGIWFPERGTLWFNRYPPEEIKRWNVIEVAVNETLAPALFEPPKPEPGTRVSGSLATKYRPRNPPDRRAAQEGTASSPSTQRVESPVTAQISLWHRFGWPGGLLIGAIIVLGAGIWLSRRS